MTHARREACLRLAEIFRNRIEELKEHRRVRLEDVCGNLGKKPFNVIMSGHAHTLPRGLVVKASDALDFPTEERNQVMIQIPIALMAGRRYAQPRRRFRSYSQGNHRR